MQNCGSLYRQGATPAILQKKRKKKERLICCCKHWTQLSRCRVNSVIAAKLPPVLAIANGKVVNAKTDILQRFCPCLQLCKHAQLTVSAATDKTFQQLQLSKCGSDPPVSNSCLKCLQT